MEPLRHTPVLLNEVLESLAIKRDGVYVDGTYGRGGHAAAVLEQLGKEGRLLAMDKDPQAVVDAEAKFGRDTRFSINQGAFTMLESVVESRQLTGKVNGILFDLGVSSPQLDDAERGFSFSSDGLLDMRMDPRHGRSAADWLATVTEQELTDVIRKFGEERFAKRIARHIVHERDKASIKTAARLAELVSAAVPSREPGKHPATRTFQALRIHINNELDDLRTCLAQCPRMLATEGRLCVISFHSLEDRIVKRFIRDQERPKDFLPAKLPIRTSDPVPIMRKLGPIIRPSDSEIQNNPRARSAVLRVAVRCP